MQEDDRPAPPPDMPIGRDLSDVSVDEIDGRIALLQGEIERLTAARKEKAGSLEAAHAFFKQPTAD